MSLVEMTPFKDHTAVWSLFGLSVHLLLLVILLGLLFSGRCRRFLKFYLVDRALVMINTCRYYYTEVAFSVRQRIMHIGSEIKRLRKNTHRRGLQGKVVRKRAMLHVYTNRGKEVAGMITSDISKEGKEAAEETASYISKEGALQHQKTKNTHNLKGMDSYWIKVLHFLGCRVAGKTTSDISKEGNEAAGETASYISKEDALQHQKTKNTHHLKGMDSYWIKVLHFLGCSTSSSSLLGIWGIRGVGKTALLRLVHTHHAAHFSFDYIFFVGVGIGCTVGSLQHVLAIILGLDQLPQMSDIPMAAKIISSSLKDKTFLLLLDDVREELDLAAIGMPMPLGHQQKVIFTARNQALCTKMGCAVNSFQMHCLGEDDAWNLFKDEVGNEIVDTHPQIKRLSRQIVEECQGLPGALCAVGRAMSTKRDVREWRHVYHLLKTKHPPLNDIQEMDDEEHPCLHLSRLLMA